MAIRVFFVAFLGLSTSAHAGSSVDGNEFLQLSYPGNGDVPTASQLFEAQQRELEAARHLGGAGPTGTFSYSVPLELPPALLVPVVSVDYANGSGQHSYLGSGWSLGLGLTIAKPLGAAAAEYAHITL